MNFRAVKLYLKFSYLVFFDKIQPSFTALKFSNNENFRALKVSIHENFRSLKFSYLAVLSDLNIRVRFFPNLVSFRALKLSKLEKLSALNLSYLVLRF